jgi:hypothetical protein
MEPVSGDICRRRKNTKYFWRQSVEGNRLARFYAGRACTPLIWPGYATKSRKALWIVCEPDQGRNPRLFLWRNTAH